ncbi:MAG TPA: fibrobacter succinogenes major paralogous domain-containing protein [candidate division Zixibacteria bacterium]|nr:fibrobacter succinogenes major paralogous domain-containing protein [candidate division Zixibacteria bacterium]MDM7971856.1 fibrobacter succinogenes major paralogous domain-containing protein [candidate division Zixibacteria bacterium]HOD66370.1 fibrobacter succinogenes major paralogous domain-containing protein [candidate division Zixibacteria bacterium]HPM37645.1 fibrobacter succinogenes major paralogous domain-containing protein [candidate division Zixibacteria bacterium]HQL23614.1 fibrob
MKATWLPAGVLAATALVFWACSGDDDSTNPDQPTIPTVTTSAVSAVGSTTATCGGTVTADGGAEVTARGVCWRTSADPTIADDTTSDGIGVGSFTSSLTGLSGGESYHMRAYATNRAGTGYGEDVPFATLGTVADYDGNTYQTVKIFNRWWMAENLKVTHYRNGDPVSDVTDPTAWNALASGACCEYANDPANVAIYGRLYNWFAVGDARGLAPAGWHVATDSEWQELVDSLGGGAVAGGKLKAAGTAYWADPNAGATNESGFSGLPGGYRGGMGDFNGIHYGAGFWTATPHQYFSDQAWNRNLGYNRPEMVHDYSGKKSGNAVRCVKD